MDEDVDCELAQVSKTQDRRATDTKYFHHINLYFHIKVLIGRAIVGHDQDIREDLLQLYEM